MINLGTLPGGSHGEAVAINNRGQLIGGSIPRAPHGISHAFVWQNGTMTDLGTLGGDVSAPTAINERDKDRRRVEHAERQGPCRHLDAEAREVELSIESVSELRGRLATLRHIDSLRESP